MKKQTNKTGLEILAAGTLLAAAAGYYFLYGSKKATRNRMKVKSWALKARADVMEQLEKATSVGEKEFNDIIGNISKKYKQVRTVDPKELELLVQELRGHWKNIQKDIVKHSKTLTGKKHTSKKKK